MNLETINISPNRDTLFGLLWVATFASYDGPESPIGTGPTPEDALEALFEMAGYPDAD
jgi:hypothetical protein